MAARLLAALARLYPAPVDPGADLRRSLSYLGVAATAERVRRASYGCAVGLAVLASISVALAPAGAWFAVALLSLAVGVAWAGPAIPRALARARRARALGGAPALVTHATASMAITPAPERAAADAASACEGMLADSLAAHVRRTDGSHRTALRSFAAEWEPWFPSLARACSLVESAGRAGDASRDRALERARSAVLTGTRDRMAAFAASIRGPATALYAFGVLLPLALAALLPAVRTAGVDVPLAAVVALYDLLFPAALVVAGGWLLGTRPVAFPPTPVPRSHPDVSDRRWPAALAGATVAALAWSLAGRWFPAWTRPLAAAGLGTGVALVWWCRSVVAVRRDVEALEGELDDALSLVGRRVAAGTAAERAVATAADELPGPAGDLLAACARRQRDLGVDLETALLGPRGALATTPSRRARGAASLLATAAREGEPAGETLQAMADHLEDLAAVERETRRAVGQVTSTLANTAAVFAPLVGGVTVALADAMGSDGPLGAVGPTDGLGLAVGAYVLVLAVVLTALSTGLERGLDRALVGYRAGLALLAATATYLVGFAGTGLVI